MSDRMPNRMSEYLPDTMSEYMSDRMSGRMPEGIPDRMPRMPGRLPVYMSDSQIECEHICQKIYQIECQTICQINRPNVWNICPNIHLEMSWRGSHEVKNFDMCHLISPEGF